MKLLDGLTVSQKDRERQFVYLHAPAGFGKTTSALLWLKHREKTAGARHTWISLDEYDNNTSEFCKRFVSALITMHPENRELRELTAHQFFDTDAAQFAIRSLTICGGLQAPCIFVLDDLHVIHNEEILNLLPTLLRRLPSGCTVLLLSRHAPPDSFSEMVTKGEVALVDSELLKFSADEIRAFFACNECPVTQNQAEQIYASTGGWAIGIRALLFADDKHYNVSLTVKYLENFLKAHVWERRDERIKTFLTCVSVARELTPELCDYLIAHEKLLKPSFESSSPSAEILAELSRENAFLRRIDENNYRFHDLFRDFLLKMLEERGERAVLAQYNRAGDYYFSKKDHFRSVDYYLKGKNDDGVAESLYFMYDYNSPYASIKDTLYTIRASLTDAIVKKHPFLLEVQIWAAYVEGRADDFERLLGEYHRQFPKIVISNPRSAIIIILIRILDYRVDLVSSASKMRMFPFKGDIMVYAPSITNNMPHFHRSVRDFSELAADTEQKLALLEKGIGFIVGEEFPAIRECLLAGLYFEKGNLTAASEHALAACAEISDGVSEECSVEIRFCAMMILATVLYCDGRDGEADKIIENVRSMIEDRLAFFLKPNLTAYLVRRRLLDGDRQAADKWIFDLQEKIFDHLTLFESYQHFTTARAYIVAGDYVGAVLILKKLLALGERYRRPLDVIEARILLAVAYRKKGRGGAGVGGVATTTGSGVGGASTGAGSSDMVIGSGDLAGSDVGGSSRSGGSVALEYLEQAICTAYEYGYTQLFASDGADLVQMLHRLQKRAVQAEYNFGVPATFVKSLYLAAAEASVRYRGMTGGQKPSHLSFTDKQKTVMRLMCDGLSRNDIADKMGLKASSVKTHVELIYRKLDVSSNVEACLKIKELGVL